MGYSCTTKASETEHRWQAACRKSTGSSNTWKEGSVEYFYETGRENADGSITGHIYSDQEPGRCKRVGSFKINPDGSVARAPAFLKAVS